MPTHAQATTPSTQASLRTQFLAALTGAPVAGWSATAPQRLIVDSFAARLAEESELRAALAEAIDLSVLTGRDDDWTDALLTWFAERRIPALPAVWDLLFQVAVAQAPLDVAPTTTLQIQASGGGIFEVDPAYHTSTVTLSAGSSYQGTVRLRARATGTGGNVTDTTLTTAGGAKILTGPAGLSMISATLSTAGRDIETSEQALGRVRGKWARLGAGWTLEAFDFLIPSAAETVTRWRVDDANPFGPGTIGVVLANASGPATGGEVTAVEGVLGSRSVKPLGSGALTVAAAASDAITINVTIVGDGTNANLAAAATTALENLCNAFPIGPATLDDSIVQAVALGAAFTSIPIDIGTGTTTITPDLPGFSGAVSISAIDLVAPHNVPADEVLVPTINVTVI